MNVPTANIVVSFSRDTMDRLFAEGATYDSLVQGLTVSGTDDALLFNSESNPNFVSFEHSLNYGNSMVMKLDFIDPRGVFEKRFISTKVLDNIIGYDYIKKDKTQDGIAVLDTNRSKITTENYNEAYYEDLKKIIQEKYNTRELFIAYGTGNNLELWSGPHRVVVTSAKVTVKGGRKISLQLTPTPNELDLNNRRGAYNEKINLNLAGMNVRCSGRSKNIKFLRESDDNFGAYDPLRHLQDKFSNVALSQFRETKSETLNILQSLGFSELKSLLSDVDVHYLIVDALRSYIQTATGNQNVIVLLPNLNLLCRKIIDETAKNARVDWFTDEKEEYQFTEEAFSDQVYEAATGQQLDPETEQAALAWLGKSGDTTDFSNKANIKGTSEGSMTASILNTQFVDSVETRNKCLALHFVETLLGKFGLIMQTSPKQTKYSGVLAEAMPYGPLAIRQQNEKAKTPKERFEFELDQNYYYGLIQESSSEGLPDHKAVIKEVLNKIKQNSRGEYTFDIGYVVETDTKILDVWANNKLLDCSRFPLFGGYESLNPTQEVIIVGDNALVKQYLYGTVDIEKKDQQISKIVTAQAAAQQVIPQSAAGAPSMVPLDGGSVDTEESIQLGLLAEKVIPLHPLDKEILTNTNYNTVIYNTAYPPVVQQLTNLEGAFGGLTNLPDEFGFSEDFTMSNFVKNNQEGLEKLPFTVFKYNTSNPNVLDMTFNFGGTYLAALKTLGFKKVVNDIAAGVVAGVLPIGVGSFPLRTEEDCVAFMKMQNYSKNLGTTEKQILIQKLASKISPELSKDINLDPLEHANLVAALLDELTGADGSLKLNVEIDQLLPGDPFTAMGELVDKLYKQSLEVSIKSLPAFHLSKTHSLSDYCVLFAQDASILQGQAPKRGPINAFFSGLYQIVGFKHRINSRGAQSEFKLIKTFGKETQVFGDEV